jgi:hypothetical protein
MISTGGMGTIARRFWLNYRRFSFSSVVVKPQIDYFNTMADENCDIAPTWIENSALTAPALLGAAAGLLLGDLMHRGARRGVGIGLGALGIAALLPFVVGGVTDLVAGPRSKLGVRRKIQRIRDAGIVAPDYNEVEEQLREQGLL